MDREGEHARVVGEDRRGAVALVHVEVDHQRAADQPLGQQQAGGDRHVVEHAEAGAEAGEGVMAAAGGVAGDAMLQRQPGGQHRAGHGAAAAQRQHRRERQAQPAHRRRVQPLLQHAGDVVAGRARAPARRAVPARARTPAPAAAARSRADRRAAARTSASGSGARRAGASRRRDGGRRARASACRICRRSACHRARPRAACRGQSVARARLWIKLAFSLNAQY